VNGWFHALAGWLAGWLSVVVDEACTQIWEAWQSGASVTSLRVSPAAGPAKHGARAAGM